MGGGVGGGGCRARSTSKKMIDEHLGLHLFPAGFNLLPSLMYASEGTSLRNGLKQNRRESSYQYGTESGGLAYSNLSGFAQLLAKKLLFRELELCCDTYS